MHNVYDLSVAEQNLINQLTKQLAERLPASSRIECDEGGEMIEIVEFDMYTVLDVTIDTISCYRQKRLYRHDFTTRTTIFRGQRIKPFGEELHYQLDEINIMLALPPQATPGLGVLLELFDDLTNQSYTTGLSRLISRVRRHWQLDMPGVKSGRTIDGSM